MEDFKSLWIQQANKDYMKNVNALIEHLKGNYKNYGELKLELMRMKSIVIYKEETRHLMNLIEMALLIVENEKNAIPIKNDN